MFKKILSMGLVCAMLVGMGTSAFATDYKSTTSKSEFADYVSSLSKKNILRNYSDEDKANILSEYLMDGFSDAEKKELENMGIYLYQYEIEEEAEIKPLTIGTPSQVDQEQPAVAYDSNADEWIVVSGGKWNDISFSGSSSREVTVSVEFSNDEGGFTEYSRRIDL